MAENNVQTKYQALSEIEHVIARPGMYVGSTKRENISSFKKNEETGLYEKHDINISPALLKLFDEIISNSVDESKREGTKLTTIKVNIDRSSNKISIYDNGGISVVMHDDTQMYIPELCFGKLRAGSNFNDDEERTGVGTNGLGSVLVNIYSNYFKVETADGSKMFMKEWHNHMSDLSLTPKIKSVQNGKHYTEITFVPDFKLFNSEGIDDDLFLAFENRVLEVAGSNPNLKIYFNDKLIGFKTFFDYCKLFANDIITLNSKDSAAWDVAIAPSNDNEYSNISLVNGARTFVGGTHEVYVLKNLVSQIKEKISKKYKYNISTDQIKNQIFLFVNATVKNPAFSSQTKERLISTQDDFINPPVITDKFVDTIMKSDIMLRIIEWVKTEKNKDELAALKKLQNNKKENVKKLVDATSKKADNKEFWIFEGDSAAGGFRKFRDPAIQGALPIRGKIKNVKGVKPSTALQNEEVKGIFAALGLTIGVCPFEYKEDDIQEIKMKKGHINAHKESIFVYGGEEYSYNDFIKIAKDTKVEDVIIRKPIKTNNMRYNEVVIASDMDIDGDCIAGLLLNLFNEYFPELIIQKKICRVITPLLVAENKKTYLPFYNMQSFEEYKSKNDISKMDIRYLKGLGSLRDSEFENMLHKPFKSYFLPSNGEMNASEFNIWYGDDAALRKNELLG